MATFDFKLFFHDSTDDKYLCFKHAVKAVMAEHEVEPEIDEFGRVDSETGLCEICRDKENKERREYRKWLKDHPLESEEV